MSFLLWQAGSELAIGAARRVLRADEVPQLLQAQQLRDELETLRRDEAQRIDAACDAARVQAHALGLEQGRAAAHAELAATLTALNDAAAQQRARQRQDVAALALEVARKLIGALAADARLVALAETAACEMLPMPAMTLLVHPEHCDAVRERLAQRPRDGAGTPAFEVRADPGCGLDDCRIETELGRVDVALEAQLARLAEAWGIPGNAHVAEADR